MSLEQSHPAHQLHGIEFHSGRPPGRFVNECKSIDQQLTQRNPGLGLPAQIARIRSQLVIGKGRQFFRAEFHTVRRRPPARKPRLSNPAGRPNPVMNL